MQSVGVRTGLASASVVLSIIIWLQSERFSISFAILMSPKFEFCQPILSLPSLQTRRLFITFDELARGRENESQPGMVVHAINSTLASLRQKDKGLPPWRI